MLKFMRFVKGKLSAIKENNIVFLMGHKKLQHAVYNLLGHTFLISFFSLLWRHPYNIQLIFYNTARVPAFATIYANSAECRTLWTICGCGRFCPRH